MESRNPAALEAFPAGQLWAVLLGEAQPQLVRRVAALDIGLVDLHRDPARWSLEGRDSPGVLGWPAILEGMGLAGMATLEVTRLAGTATRSKIAATGSWPAGLNLRLWGMEAGPAATRLNVARPLARAESQLGKLLLR